MRLDLYHIFLKGIGTIFIKREKYDIIKENEFLDSNSSILYIKVVTDKKDHINIEI